MFPKGGVPVRDDFFRLCVEKVDVAYPLYYNKVDVFYLFYKEV